MFKQFVSENLWWVTDRFIIEICKRLCVRASGWFENFTKVYTPAVLLHDVEAVRQLWAVKFFLSIPDRRKTSFIHLTTVAFDTGWCDFA